MPLKEGLAIEKYVKKSWDEELMTWLESVPAGLISFTNMSKTAKLLGLQQRELEYKLEQAGKFLSGYGNGIDELYVNVDPRGGLLIVPNAFRGRIIGVTPSYRNQCPYDPWPVSHGILKVIDSKELRRMYDEFEYTSCWYRSNHRVCEQPVVFVLGTGSGGLAELAFIKYDINLRGQKPVVVAIRELLPDNRRNGLGRFPVNLEADLSGHLVYVNEIDNLEEISDILLEELGEPGIKPHEIFC